MEVGLLNILRIYDYFPLALLLIFVSLLVRNLISLFCFVSDLGLEAEPGGGGALTPPCFSNFYFFFFEEKLNLHKERKDSYTKSGTIWTSTKIGALFRLVGLNGIQMPQRCGSSNCNDQLYLLIEFGEDHQEICLL